MRSSFVLYVDSRQHLELLTDADAGLLIKSIFRYADTGDLPENLPPAAAMAFSFIRAQIDRDWVKYKETCAKRSEAGRKGAAVTNSKRAANSENAAFAAANPADNDTDTENDSDSVCDTVPVNDILPGRRKSRRGTKTEPDDFNALRNAALEKLNGYR